MERICRTLPFVTTTYSIGKRKTAKYAFAILPWLIGQLWLIFEFVLAWPCSWVIYKDQCRLLQQFVLKATMSSWCLVIDHVLPWAWFTLSHDLKRFLQIVLFYFIFLYNKRLPSPKLFKGFNLFRLCLGWHFQRLSLHLRHSLYQIQSWMTCNQNLWK